MHVHPESRQPALIFKKPQFPVYSNQLRYSADHTITSYKAMCRATTDAQNRKEKKLRESRNGQMDMSEKERLLSSEYRDSGYKTKKKPGFTKMNILGNMKKDKLTRAVSSGGPSMRPAIASATGGGLSFKPSDYWPVT